MSAQSSDPALSYERASTALHAGDFPMAESSAREFVAIEPQHPGGWAVLGSALHAQGRFTEAEQAFLELTRRAPQEPMYWMNVGTARRCAEQLDEALAAFATAAALGADSADFHFNLGLVHIDRRDFESAVAVLAKAVAQAPQDPEIRFRYAYACYETLRTDEALEALKGWERLPDAGSNTNAHAGFLLLKLGDVARAETIVRGAAQQPGADPLAVLTLVQVLERTNRINEARKLLDQLDASPSASQLGTELTATQGEIAQREDRHEEACAAYRQALQDSRDASEQHLHLYPLARSLDALGQYEEAWSTLQAAHRSQLERFRLTAPVWAARGSPTLGITQFSADPDDIAGWSKDDAPPLEQSPVFIVAFPRSGTTLLELSLDAHPALASMDEQPFLQNALDDILEQGVEYPRRLASLSPAQLRDIRERYWQRVGRKVRLSAGQRLVDKNPLNLLRLPAIRRLFPHSPVLLAIRHPCDVILSCYQQHFRAPDVAMLCMDVKALATGYRRAFDFWYEQHALLGPRSLEVRYETLVAEFEQQMRAIASFLELPWTDAMLQPGRQAHDRGFISTPSYSQVVQPVNSKAVGKWRRYEQQLAGIIPIIQPYLQRWSYEA